MAGDAEMVGRLVAGRYHLVRMLGDGGMGAVYKAADQVLRRFVAIKLLHASVAENPSSVERFEREARAAAAIGHPNIIDILDFGREGARPYMVMEYLRGRSLSQVIATDGQLTIKRAATIAIHTLAGLQAAHDRSILHRDLKPANLMLVVRLGDQNFVKVCDFGFAALFAPTRFDSKSLTPERTLVGTPAYAAPERLRGDDRRDPRLDVYSVGVLLYEMLAGRRPFDAPTFRELARKVRKEPPPPLRELRPDIPPDLEHIVMASLAKEREDRFASAETMAEALFPFGGMRVALRDDQPSDSFTMEMARIKSRDTRHKTSTGLHPADADAPRKRVAAPKPKVPPGYESAPPQAMAPVATSPQLRVEPRAEQPRAEPQLRAEPQRREAPRQEAPRHEAPRHEAPRHQAPRQETARGMPPPESDPNEERPKTRIQRPASARRAVPPPDEDETQRLSEEDAAVLMHQLDLASAARARAEAQREEPAPPRTPRAAPVERPPPSGPDGRYYSGQVVLAILRFVSRKFGERALKVVLDSMPEAERSPFVNGIAAESWVDMHAVRTLVEHIDARLGQDDLHLVLEAGRAAAEGAFDVMRDVRPPGPPPELLIAEMPGVFEKVMRGIGCEVRRVGRGYGRVELVETGEPSLTLAVGTLGFLARSLEHFGADDVEVNLLSARALGDPQTLVDLSWFA